MIFCYQYNSDRSGEKPATCAHNTDDESDELPLFQWNDPIQNSKKTKGGGNATEYQLRPATSTINANQKRDHRDDDKGNRYTHRCLHHLSKNRSGKRRMTVASRFGDVNGAARESILHTHPYPYSQKGMDGMRAAPMPDS